MPREPRKPADAEPEAAETNRTPEPPQRRTCGTMPVHERLVRSDQAYTRARTASENGHVALQSGQRPLLRAGVTTIPVVVHVVHHSTAQDIPKEQIESQLDVLNRDYRM